MAKAFTDIIQSRELAEILPTESADAWLVERYEGKVTHLFGEFKPKDGQCEYFMYHKPNDNDNEND